MNNDNGHIMLDQMQSHEKADQNQATVLKKLNLSD